MPRIVKICGLCKKEFSIYPYREKNAKYCSKKCRSKDITKKLWRNFLYREKIINSRSGYKHSNETKEKIRVARLANNPGAKRGEKHWNWKGGISKEKGYDVYLTNIRRARKMKNGGFHSFKEWKKLKEKYNYLCLCCKKQEPEIKLTEDHIIPLSKGGGNNIDNIQPLCQKCNSLKWAKTINYATF